MSDLLVREHVDTWIVFLLYRESVGVCSSPRGETAKLQSCSSWGKSHYSWLMAFLHITEIINRINTVGAFIVMGNFVMICFSFSLFHLCANKNPVTANLKPLHYCCGSHCVDSPGVAQLFRGRAAKTAASLSKWD